MELLVSILASLVIALSPQASEAPSFSTPSHQIGTTLECPEDEPCWDYEAEENVDEATIAAFGFNPIEDAWFAFEKLEVPLSSSQTGMAYEYVASFEGSVPEFGPTYFSLTSPTHLGFKHVFKVTILTAA